MSAILLGQKLLDNPFIAEEKEQKENNSPKDDKEQIIEGKNKTYIISKTLGKGTFGKVKLAYNKDNINEKYACKILLKSNIKDEDDYMRCKREMDILKRMHHVNVVRTYEIISTKTTYFILMDFCAKGELFNYIVQKQHLSEEKSAFFYYQLINGIYYIHQKGICHRDLKPENLLLTEKYKLKIIDFGLSNYFKGNLLETPCGSPCYASPEMVIGNKYNGFCIDIWSSGIILYAMLCGYLPFEEMENDEYNEVLFRNIVECNVDYPNEFITPIAKDLLSKILVKDPTKRITIEEIKCHNFYLLGELLYKQTFENMGNINELMILNDGNDNLMDSDALKSNDTEVHVPYLNSEDVIKNYELNENETEDNKKVDIKTRAADDEEKKDNKKDVDIKIDINNLVTPLNSEKKEKENNINLANSREKKDDEKPEKDDNNLAEKKEQMQIITEQNKKPSTPERKRNQNKKK